MKIFIFRNRTVFFSHMKRGDIIGYPFLLEERVRRRETPVHDVRDTVKVLGRSEK